MEDTGPGNGKNAGWYEAGMPGVLAQLLPLGRLPGSLARLADIWTAPGSLARFTLKKFLRFLISQELFLTRSPSRPIEALFTAQSGLTRELLTPKFHIDPRTSLSGPANKLRDTAQSACTLTASTDSGHSSLNFRSQQVLPSFYKNFIAI